MAKNKSDHVLGIMVSEDALHAVLVERSAEGPTVQARLSRVRGSDYSGSDTGLPGGGGAPDTPDFADEATGDDFTIQFGDEGGAGDNMFLGSEFGEFDGGDGSGSGGDGSGATAGGASFQFELEELLSECEARGFDNPEVAFCLTTSEVDELELRLPPDEKASDEAGELGLPLPAKRSKLFKMLEEQYDGVAEKERVAFVPMMPAEDGRHRVLALIARPTGPVLTTVKTMREQKGVRVPKARLLDAEIPLYLGMARAALQLPAGSKDKTLVVRANMTDTMALFMEGNTLRQAESLRSLTARDAAETICSRVLLLQDEYGIGDVQNVLLVGENGERDLIEGFEMFFPDAEVHALRDALPDPDEDAAGAHVPATGAALRQLNAPAFAPSFQDINLLPKGLTRKQFSLPVGWSVPALFAVLFVTALGFVWLYLSNANTIAEQRSELRRYKSQVAEMDERALQARIDSMQAVTNRYVDGLRVLDTLLQGSNKWSKALADISQQTASVQGVWVDTWSPQQPQVLRIAGNATARHRIVGLAERLDGSINRVTFSEIRDWPIYSFEMTVPLDMEIPEAARYLRQQMATASDDAASDATGDEVAAGTQQEAKQPPPAATISLNEQQP